LRVSKPFWKFIVNAATKDQPESVDLRIEGEMVDIEWAWLYEWFGIPAASPNAFRNEIAKHAGKNIIVRINSYGGSVFAGIGIYDTLMEHKRTGAKVTTVAEKAMSAATLPLMAGDEKLVTIGGMVMTHNPLSEIYGLAYASDFRKAADVLDEIKEAIINIYEEGTALDRVRISELMDQETYMSAQTAIKERFVDGVYKAGESQKESRFSVKNEIPNFIFNRMAIQNAANLSMEKLIEIIQEQQTQQEQEQTAQPQAKAKQPTPVENKKSKGDEGSMEIKNIEDLKNAHPELVAQVEAAARTEGATNERERIKGIEAIAKNIAPNLVNKAKFEEPKDAKDLAFEALQANANLGQTYLNNATEDNKASGANEVPAAPVDNGGQDTKPANINDRVKTIAAKLDAQRRGIKQ
jgi:ATP-dependent protease ClpP protease subunit